jgi:DNA (cytosine-5)-methyltransferase 1
MSRSALDGNAPHGAGGASRNPTDVERFKVRGRKLIRCITGTNGSSDISLMGQRIAHSGPATADEAEQAWLMSKEHPGLGSGNDVRIVDLYSGCGGLSVGLAEAARALGRSITPVLAVDCDPVAAETYRLNFPTAESLCGDVRGLFPGTIGSRLTSVERRLESQYSNIDILAGGPPCQGHSDFNNMTRHSDEKNALFRTMVRAAQVLQPNCVLIENVPGAMNDRNGVVQRSAEDLLALGYSVSVGVVDMSKIGVPQRRKRLLLLASLTEKVQTEDLERRHRRPQRGVSWAINDLEIITNEGPGRLIDMTAKSAPATRRRIDYLFDNELYDLPDIKRPACHAKGGHSYGSIYGRLSWGLPSQTITTGFYSMCMGRYVHPSQRRTITAHEAARLQYFPDWFNFDSVRNRTSLARMIGNAVPSRLSYAVALEWLR